MLVKWKWAKTQKAPEKGIMCVIQSKTGFILKKEGEKHT